MPFSMSPGQRLRHHLLPQLWLSGRGRIEIKGGRSGPKITKGFVTMANNNGEHSKMISLCDLLPGQTAKVIKIDTVDGDRLLKLSALGLVPGSLVRLQQRLPAYVIWVGETQLSLDKEVARAILLLKV